MTDRGHVLHPDRLDALVEALNLAEVAGADLARALRDLADAQKAARVLEEERGRAATVLAASAADGERRRVLDYGCDLLAPAAVVAGERFRVALDRLHAATDAAIHPAGH